MKRLLITILIVLGWINLADAQYKKPAAGAIKPSNISARNSPTATYTCLKKDASGDRFEWGECGGEGTSVTEVSDETFNATNFNGDTTHGVSQDDFYDRIHLIDSDDDGVLTDEAWLQSIPFTPSGGISATTVHSAIAEIDTEKANASTVSTHTSNTSNPHSTTAAQVGADPAGTDNSGLTANQKAAISGAASPTALNPFATIADVTAGGGYTDEMAQDAVGAMVAGNTESGISVEYDDTNAKLNFTVSFSNLDDDNVLFDDADGLWAASTIGAALEELNNSINDGTPNGTGAKVHWSQLLGVPAGFTDGDKGDISVSGGGTVLTLDSDAIAASDLPAITSATSKTWDLSGFTLILPQVAFTSSFSAEGATADDYETMVYFADPTADRTFTIGNYDSQTVADGDVDASGHITALASNATATTPSAGDNDTSVPTTAFVQAEVDSTMSGTLGTPNTTTPLSPTWNGPVHIVYVGATQTINLPAAAGYDGRAIGLMFQGSYVATVDPNSSEVLYRSGTAQTGGVSMTVTGTSGQFCYIMSDGTAWSTWGCTATLAVGS